MKLAAEGAGTREGVGEGLAVGSGADLIDQISSIRKEDIGHKTTRICW